MAPGDLGIRKLPPRNSELASEFGTRNSPRWQSSNSGIANSELGVRLPGASEADYPVPFEVRTASTQLKFLNSWMTKTGMVANLEKT